MNIATKIASTLSIMTMMQFTFAQDITGVWQSIDDRTSSPKALIEIKKDASGYFTGTIIKVTPRAGYQPQELCTKCMGDQKNKPIVGLNIFQQLKQVKDNEYSGGQILDPLSGKNYKLNMKLRPNGNTLRVNGYIGVQAIGRTQTWIRQK